MLTASGADGSAKGMATPTGKHSSETTHAVNDDPAFVERLNRWARAANDDPALGKAVVTKLEMLMGIVPPERELLRIWMQIEKQRDQLTESMKRLAKAGLWQRAEAYRERVEQLDDDIEKGTRVDASQRGHSLNQLQDILNADYLAIENDAREAVQVSLEDPENENLQCEAESLLRMLARDHLVDLKEEVAHDLATRRARTGDTSSLPGRIASRIVRHVAQPHDCEGDNPPKGTRRIVWRSVKSDTDIR